MLVRMGECVVCHQRGDVRKFRRFGFKELFPGWSIEKKVANCDRSSQRQSGFFDASNFSAVNLNDRAGRLICCAGLEPQPRDGSDRRKRLSPKTESRDAQKILGILYFRGGVPLESQHGIVANHAASIVGDLDEFLSARLYAELDPGRSGIERVFEHLFDDGCRTLDNLTSGNLVRDIFGEYVD